MPEGKTASQLLMAAWGEMAKRYPPGALRLKIVFIIISAHWICSNKSVDRENLNSMSRLHKLSKPSAGLLVALLFPASVLFLPPGFAAGDADGWKHLKDEGSKQEVFGNFAGAELAYAKSLSLTKPPNASAAERGEVMARLANVMICQQKFDAAEPYFNELLKIIPSLKIDGKGNEDFFSCVDALSNAYFVRVLGFKRISAIQHSIRLIDTAFGEKHPEILRELAVLSSTYLALGMNQEALTFANRALSIAKKDKSEKGKLLYWKTLALVGACRKSVGDWAGAQKSFENAVMLMNQSPNRFSLTAASAKAQLAIIEFHMHRKDESKRLFQEAEGLFLSKIYELDRKNQKDLSTSGPELVAFAQMYVAFNQYEKAEPICKRAILWTQSSLGPKDPNLINELRLHGFVLSRLGRMKEVAKTRGCFNGACQRV